MIFNISKYFIVTFTRLKNPVSFYYSMNGVALKRVTELQDLGVTLDSALQWNIHIKNIISKANRVSGLIKRTLGWHAPQDTKFILYSSLVRPILEYCSPLWGGLNQKYTKSIERLQRTMTRYICGYSKAEYNERLLHLHLAPLSLRRDQNDVIFFWKCLHRIYDLGLTKFVSFSHDNPRQTRSSTESFRLPIFKKEAFRRSFFNRIYYVCNKLLNDVRCITETSHFKNNVKNVMFFYFFTKYFQRFNMLMAFAVHMR